MGQNATISHKSTISLEQNDEKAWFFLHVDTDLRKLKVDWKMLEWAWSKMGVATLKYSKMSCISIKN